MLSRSFADRESPYDGDVRGMVPRQGGGDVRERGATEREASMVAGCSLRLMDVKMPRNVP